MRLRNAIKARVLAIVTCLVLTVSPLALADEQEDLAKESQNPIANFVSLPFKNNFDLGGGVGPLVNFGKQPLDLKLRGFYNVKKPKGAADRRLQLQVKLLLPK